LVSLLPHFIVLGCRPWAKTGSSPERISGKSVRALAKSQGCSVAQVNQVIDAWAEEAINDQLRKRSLCLELERLDELMRVFYQRAINDADVQSGLLVAKLIERRSVMLGLNAPALMTLQLIEPATPKPTTHDRILQAIQSLQDRTKDPEDPTTH
jgi:hypothetical protein